MAILIMMRMMMKLKMVLLIIFLLPLLIQAQSKTYLFIQTEVDLANALFGGTVNPPGYDGVFQAGLSTNWFRGALFYETFSIIDYQSAGANLTYIFNSEKAFRQGVGLQLSVIKKPEKMEPSVGLNAVLEFHFKKFFFSARGQSKMRSDWNNKIVNSGFVGVGYKIFPFKRRRS